MFVKSNRPINRAPTWLAFLLLTCLTLPAANAGQLGRLFFTPEQRAQLDYAHARDAVAEGDTSAILTVNGIVQKNGGARTVWVNGVAQSADSGERTTGSQTVTIPGKSRPVRLKVGDKILLDQAPPGSQNAAGE
jgi:hypothetical protein